MKQLSGLDASFLSMETATTFGHVSGLGELVPDVWHLADLHIAEIDNLLRETQK